MKELNPRIRTALLSINPTSKNPAWHGCPTALGVLRGVSAQIAVWKPYAGMNCIREIALHIAFWENSVANRISGTKIPVGFEQRKTGWVKRNDDLGEKQWKKEIGIVKHAHERLVDALVGFDSKKLDRPIGNGTSRKAVELIHGVAEHTLYHTAQMKMLSRLAKNVQQIVGVGMGATMAGPGAIRRARADSGSSQ